VKCAGRCGKDFNPSAALMDAVVIYFDPGKRGGKKFRLYYCSPVPRVTARSRARMTHEQQEEVINKAESRLARKGSRKNGGNEG